MHHLIIVLLEIWPFYSSICKQVSCYFNTGQFGVIFVQFFILQHFCDWWKCLGCFFSFENTKSNNCRSHVPPVLCQSGCQSDVKHLAFLQVWTASQQSCGQRWEKRAALLTADSDWLQQNILFFLARCSRACGSPDQCAIRSVERLPRHWTIGSNWRFATSTCRRLWVGIAWREFWHANQNRTMHLGSGPASVWNLVE